MWPAESIMQSMRPAMLCRFPTPDLDHNLSDIHIGNIRRIYRTNCTLRRTKKHAQKELDISDLYVKQILC